MFSFAQVLNRLCKEYSVNPSLTIEGKINFVLGQNLHSDDRAVIMAGKDNVIAAAKFLYSRKAY